MQNLIAQDFEKELPDIIRTIASNHCLDEFIKNPDFLEDRLKKWHQFGIITHSKNVRAAFNFEIKSYLNDWNIYDSVMAHLDHKIENYSKNELFEISIPLHDLGKVLASKSEKKNRKHELFSSYLINNTCLKEKLRCYGIFNESLDYLSNIIKTHSMVGKGFRDILKDSGNLNIENLNSNTSTYCENIINCVGGLEIETGIYFLCDVLGKTDIRYDGDNMTIDEIDMTIKKRNLNPDLRYAVLQQPINLKISKIYLKYLF